MAKKKSFFQKIKCFFSKMDERESDSAKRGAYVGMRASIISKNTGGGYCLRCNNREKCDCRGLYTCKQRYSGWGYGSRCSLQNCCEVAA